MADFRGCLELDRAALVAWKAVFHSGLREPLRILVAISSCKLNFDVLGLVGLLEKSPVHFVALDLHFGHFDRC